VSQEIEERGCCTEKPQNKAKKSNKGATLRGAAKLL
jgi:hypothetical protein